MGHLQIFHNPRCSKSRQTLEILQQQGLQPKIIEYLKNPLTVEQITQLLSLLGFDSARQLMRKGEEEFKQQKLADPALSEAELLSAMHRSPKLIERPIVVHGDKAVIGRPPQNVLSIL
jgi:arsenate reductase